LHYTLLTSKLIKCSLKQTLLTLLTILNVNDYILIHRARQHFPVNPIFLFSYSPYITTVTRILMH